MIGQQHTPAALYPRERPGTHFTGGLVGPRAGLDGRKIIDSVKLHKLPMLVCAILMEVGVCNSQKVRVQCVIKLVSFSRGFI